MLFRSAGECDFIAIFAMAPVNAQNAAFPGRADRQFADQPPALIRYRAPYRAGSKREQQAERKNPRQLLALKPLHDALQNLTLRSPLQGLVPDFNGFHFFTNDPKDFAKVRGDLIVLEEF